ncbi:hypothetical protein [Nodularia spumigena]|jgi:hypothetical protein|uniref:hypothetical protein n=1 Tax=Nodularia spumigena TaxID=70799 RepID=UPI00232ED0C1|nr:hypothetical protein [Nodularia spumigena]MDB9498584.1 hypothetical protein [Nodularia spumigena CS-336/02]
MLLHHFIELLIVYLQRKPIWGAAGAGVASSTPLLLKIDQVPIYLTITGASLGIILTILTIYAKVLEIKKHRRETKQTNKNAGEIE